MNGSSRMAWAVVVAALFLSSAPAAHAVLLGSGTLGTADGTLQTFGPSSGVDWDNLTLQWRVSMDGPLYTYEYQWIDLDGDKAISHFMIEASPTFTAANLVATQPAGSDIEVGHNGATRFFPDDTGDPLYGIKWDSLDGYEFTGSITTDRAPIWGDLFIKDGTVSAVNSGYSLADPLIEFVPLQLNTTGFGWLAVPDTHTTMTPPFCPPPILAPAMPEPATASLLLAALGVLSGRRRGRFTAAHP